MLNNERRWCEIVQSNYLKIKPFNLSRDMATHFKMRSPDGHLILPERVLEIVTLIFCTRL